MRASVIIPVKDEAENVKPLCSAFAELVQSDRTVGEILFVDDHSRDSTLAEVKTMAQTLPILRAVPLDSQHGKGATIRRGFMEAQFEILVMMDGDQQYTPFDLPKLLAPILNGSVDLVIGKGGDCYSSAFRRFSSRSFRWAFTQMFGFYVDCPNEGLKAILKSKFNELNLTSNNFDFDIELLVKARQRSFRMAEVTITRKERAAGKSKIHIISTTVRFSVKLVRLWFTQRKWL